MTRNKAIAKIITERLKYSTVDDVTRDLLVKDFSGFLRSEFEKEDKSLEDAMKVICNITHESAMGEFMVIDLLVRIQDVAHAILVNRGCLNERFSNRD